MFLILLFQHHNISFKYLYYVIGKSQATTYHLKNHIIVIYVLDQIQNKNKNQLCI